jgi:8-oxo-dGTP pyrophosphatase MutT (NUDIX family)
MVKKYRSPRQKIAFGVACCRQNVKTGEYEILLVQKKHTYAFTRFVMEFDKYKTEKELLNIFDSMTILEKELISSFDYDILWKSICGSIPQEEQDIVVLNTPHIVTQPTKLSRVTSDVRDSSAPRNNYFGFGNSHSGFSANDEVKIVEAPTTRFSANYNQNTSFSSYEFYAKRKTMFHNEFARSKHLVMRLMSESKSSSTIWELPKGRPQTGEKEFDTTLRECKEEIGSGLDKIRFYMLSLPIKQQYQVCEKDRTFVYINYYHIAEPYDMKWEPSLNFKINGTNEVQTIGWFSTQRIKSIMQDQMYIDRLLSVVELIFKEYKKLRKPLYGKRYKYL